MPDLNTVPHSPHPQGSPSQQQVTRQHSQGSGPSPPASSDSLLHILPSNQNVVNANTGASSVTATQGSPSQVPQVSQQPSNPAAPRSESVVIQGPGPLRHPRPLTTSELHAELEKEQEQVVNRLSRELSLLRAAHNASVVSSTSSTSGHEALGEAPLLSGSGFTIPNSRRDHRRASSTASQTLANPVVGSLDGRRPSQPISMSRQNSTNSRASQAHSPAPSSSLDPSNYFQQQRVPHHNHSSAATVGSGAPTSHGSEQLSPGLIPTTLRYEEIQQYKQELDVAKKENDVLRKRVMELERQVRDRASAGDASQAARRDSVSTTASVSVVPSGGVSIAGPRDSAAVRPERERVNTMQSVSSIAVGVPEGEVQFGESAASSGLGNHSQ